MASEGGGPVAGALQKGLQSRAAGDTTRIPPEEAKKSGQGVPVAELPAEVSVETSTETSDPASQYAGGRKGEGPIQGPLWGTVKTVSVRGAAWR